MPVILLFRPNTKLWKWLESCRPFYFRPINQYFLFQVAWISPVGENRTDTRTASVLLNVLSRVTVDIPPSLRFLQPLHPLFQYITGWYIMHTYWISLYRSVYIYVYGWLSTVCISIYVQMTIDCIDHGTWHPMTPRAVCKKPDMRLIPWQTGVAAAAAVRNLLFYYPSIYRTMTAEAALNCVYILYMCMNVYIYYIYATIYIYACGVYERQHLRLRWAFNFFQNRPIGISWNKAL